MNLPTEEELQERNGEPALPLLFRSMDLQPLALEAKGLIPVADDPRPDPEQIAFAARQQGMLEGRRQTEADMQALLQQERQGVSRALEEFVREKQRYFAGLEKEVVQLSLAIAARVLHREAGMDPMFLAGAARVALEEVKDDRDAVLRVAVEDAAAWAATMQREGRAVEVRADPSLTKGECFLEAANGSVELGVRAQLQEIEHGFFELLGRNPAMAT